MSIFKTCRDYLQGDLPLDAKEKFISQLERDEKALKALGTIELIGRQAIRELTEKAFTESQKSPRRIWLPVVSLTAGIALLIGIGIWWTQPSGYHLKDVFEDRYAFHHGTIRSDGYRGDSLYNLAIQAYKDPKKESFSRAINLFNELLNDPLLEKHQKDEILLYKGLSYLELEIPDSTLSSFAKIEQRSVHLYSEVRWYSGMAYLLKEDLRGSRETFSAIWIDPRLSHSRREEALDICLTIGCP